MSATFIPTPQIDVNRTQKDLASHFPTSRVNLGPPLASDSQGRNVLPPSLCLPSVGKPSFLCTCAGRAENILSGMGLSLFQEHIQLLHHSLSRSRSAG